MTNHARATLDAIRNAAIEISKATHGARLAGLDGSQWDAIAAAATALAHAHNTILAAHTDATINTDTLSTQL